MNNKLNAFNEQTRDLFINDMNNIKEDFKSLGVDVHIVCGENILYLTVEEYYEFEMRKPSVIREGNFTQECMYTLTQYDWDLYELTNTYVGADFESIYSKLKDHLFRIGEHLGVYTS